MFGMKKKSKESPRKETGASTTSTEDFRVQKTEYAWVRDAASPGKFRSPVKDLFGQTHMSKIVLGPSSECGDAVLVHRPGNDRLSKTQEAVFSATFDVYGSGEKNTVEYLLPKGKEIDLYHALRLGSVITQRTSDGKLVPKNAVIECMQALARTSKATHDLLWYLARYNDAMYKEDGSMHTDESIIERNMGAWDKNMQGWVANDGKRYKSFDNNFLPALKLAIKQLFDCYASIVTGTNLTVRPADACDTVIIEVSVQH